MVAVVAPLLALASSAEINNILFLIADDLRPQLNKAYGKTFMHTPNIDAVGFLSLKLKPVRAPPRSELTPC